NAGSSVAMASTASVEIEIEWAGWRFMGLRLPRQRPGHPAAALTPLSAGLGRSTNAPRREKLLGAQGILPWTPHAHGPYRPGYVLNRPLARTIFVEGGPLR